MTWRKSSLNLFITDIMFFCFLLLPSELTPTLLRKKNNVSHPREIGLIPANEKEREKEKEKERNPRMTLFRS